MIPNMTHFDLAWPDLSWSFDKKKTQWCQIHCSRTSSKVSAGNRKTKGLKIVLGLGKSWPLQPEQWTVEWKLMRWRKNTVILRMSLTRAGLRGMFGHPLCCSLISKKRCYTSVHTSFPHMFWKFQTQVTQGQVARSRQVTYLRKSLNARHN